MGFRDDLDLGDILPKYQWALDNKEPPPRSFEGEYIETPVVERRNPGIPRRIFNGPAACSTSVALVPTYPPAVCWDVNGWYAALGAHHRMSRKELGQAYMDAGGQESDRLTWIMTALLDPEIKRAYDLTPLGELYLNDPLIMERLKAMALRIAKEKGIDAQRVLEDMGLTLVDDSSERTRNSPPDLLDSESNSSKNVLNNGEWAYSFWVWHIEEHELYDYAQAEYWQESLIAACARQGIVTQLRVGVMDAPATHRVQEIDGVPVVFINRITLINPDIADLAVDELSTYL